MTPTTDDAPLFAELDRRFRQRFIGVWIYLGLAALLAPGVIFSVPMMHSGHPTAAMGTIVAVEKDDAGEIWMTSEFADAEGVTHRDRQTQGYHYWPGDPVVGQRIEYFYEGSALTGDLHAYPRADRLLQVVFGVPMLFLGLLGLGFAIRPVRQRTQRRELVRTGRRERAQAPVLRHRSFVLPAGGNSQEVQTWRLEARYFDTARSEYVDVRSEWYPAPAPTLRKDAVLQVFVDPLVPTRYWLPVGPLSS